MRIPTIFLCAIIALGGCVSPAPVMVTASNARPPAEAGRLERELGFHEERVKRDPQGALGWAMLADAALAVASEQDDDAAAARAEAAARQSLKIRRKHNVQAALALTRSLLAQHQFKEAQAAVNVAQEIAPGDLSAQRLAGEIMLELGQYAEFKRHWPKFALMNDPASRLLRARWLTLTGKPGPALDLTKKAVDEVEAIATISAETLSWYRVQLAQAYAQAGLNQEAEKAFDSALELNPNSHLAWGGKARLAARQKDWAAVLDSGERAAREATLTDIQGLMIQAERALGRKDAADKRLARLIEANGGRHQLEDHGHGHHHHAEDGRHTHNRLFAVALTNLGEYLRFAHHLAEEDLKDRADIYAEHAFAWTTYRYWLLTPPALTGEGDFLRTEAQAAMKRALRTGTRDPELLAHAAEIFAAKPH